jgi:hypothetical protein
VAALTQIKAAGASASDTAGTQSQRSTSMSRINVAVKNDLQLVALLHDELKLQAHLFKADAKTRWNELEDKWSDLQEHIGRAKVAGQDAGAEAETAIRSLVDTLRAGYTSVRNALNS